ncbi:hypothetical protein MPSEU_000084400 [Mayamaea pseudoterrestris]|nr:hypothetical protein MPSEU_000084400 [Mayamaea pseudoterrestris]
MTAVSMTDINALFASLMEYVETTGEEDSRGDGLANKSLIMLLKIKETHQRLTLSLEKEKASLVEKKKHSQRILRNMDALEFERKHLERQIEAATTFQTPKLVQMARNEEKQDTITDDDALVAYFEIERWSDKQHRVTATAQIHREINARGKLTERLRRRREELAQLKKQLEEKRRFLDQILPEQVAAMERSSLSLQKSFALPKTSTERKERLESAHGLPPPLYTLFKQLQLYVDLVKTSQGLNLDENSKLSVTFIHHDPEVGHDSAEDQVLLTLPIPNVANPSGKPKRITLHFYLDVDNHQILLSVSGGANILVQDKFLQELFPGDFAPATASPQQRVYHWSNYMAGLYSVGMPPTLPSTRGIILQLQRRVHSSAILKHVLMSLQQRKQLPNIPSDNDEVNTYSGVKIISFEEGKDESSTEELSVKWTCKLRHGNQTRALAVRIDMARYPVSPPVWDLQQIGHEKVSSAVTYDEIWATLEERVNYSMLEQTLLRDETSFPCDWILALQLKEILKFIVSNEIRNQGQASRKRKTSR